MTARTVNFTHIPLWVQVWGLPFDLTTKEMGQDIGRGLGRVIEVDCKAVKADQSCFLRIRGGAAGQTIAVGWTYHHSRG